MHYHFCAIAKVTFFSEDGKSSIPVKTEMRLETSPNLNKEMYTDESGIPTEAGTKCTTTTMVVGLASNIHLAARMGWRSKEEHLKFIIDNLTDMVMQEDAGIIQPGVMEY